MRYLYVILAIVAITIISVFTFKEDAIYYNYAKFTIENGPKVLENNYYYKNNFLYVDDYSGLEIHNKEELYESVYYLVNSGVTKAKRYFDINYVDYEKDYNELFSNKLKLNSINNFVHPYNTFSSINASLKGYSLEITIKYNDSYSELKRNLIDSEVNKIINNLINNSMNDREKIKVIHDYVINNTVYDENFCISENVAECTTTSPYQSDTAYGALFERNGICSGYTDLMAIFLNKLNITNYRVTNDSHTWNAVKIDNKWYHLDTTWDDPISDKSILTHTYFLITTHEDSLLEESHVFDKEVFIELN